MKLNHSGVGRITIRPKKTKVRVSLVSAHSPNCVAADDVGYYVEFSSLRPFRFFIHPAWSSKEKAQGFSLTEESTGSRVAWALTDQAVTDAGTDRLNQFLKNRGYLAFAELIKRHPKITEITQEANGTNYKPRPEDDPTEDTGGVSRISTLRTKSRRAR